MLFHKAASVILCAGFITHAGAPSGSPPLPVPRPAPQADYPRHAAQAEARIPDLDQYQTLEAKEPDGRTAYRTLIKNEAILPPDIADAVTAIESGYDPGAIGDAGEIGLMQVRPETAAMLGFNGDLAELARPDVNIHLWRNLSWPGLASGRGRSLPRPDEIPRGPRRRNHVGPIHGLLRPRARTLGGGRIALRGGGFRTVRFRPGLAGGASGETWATNPHGGGEPGLLGRA
jgi:hypothetical protein